MTFRVGQKVVCVGWPWRGWINWLDEKLHPFASPNVGDVLTICNVNHDGELALEFYEFPSPQTKYWGAGFLASGFRPVVERKTDISIFQAMLTPKKQTADNRLDAALHDHGFDPPHGG